MMNGKSDRRTERTRDALLRAFVVLYFERDYDEITVADIAERANVGRSTFYEHFRGKDALLAASYRRPFGTLAGIVDAEADVGSLHALFEHFWSNRARASAVRNLSLRRALTRVLAGMLVGRLQRRAKQADLRIAPERLRWGAVTISEALVGPITVWLAGDLSASPATVADMLRECAQALARTVCGA